MAADYFKHKIDDGDDSYLSHYGASLEFGHGVVTDFVSAAQWYKRSADEGNSAAQVQQFNAIQLALAHDQVLKTLRGAHGGQCSKAIPYSKIGRVCSMKPFTIKHQMSRRLLDAPSDEDQVPWDQADTNTDALDEAYQHIEGHSHPRKTSLPLRAH
jgi:TPR repeat protein